MRSIANPLFSGQKLSLFFILSVLLFTSPCFSEEEFFWRLENGKKVIVTSNDDLSVLALVRGSEIESSLIPSFRSEFNISANHRCDFGFTRCGNESSR